MLPVSMATGILIARVLGPTGLGLYTLMIWLPGILAGPMSLGLGNANLFFASRDSSLSKPLVANSIISSAVVSGVVVALVFLTITFHPGLLPAELEKWQVLLPLADLPFRMFNSYGANIFNALREHQAFRRAEVIQTLVYAVGAFAGVFAMHLTLLAFIGAQIFASACTAMYTSAVLIRGGRFGLRPDWHLLKRGVLYGGVIQIGSILRATGQKLDELILFRFAGSHPLGLLTLGRNISNRIRVIPLSLGTIVVPELAKVGTTSSVLAAKACRRLLLAMTFVVVLAMVLAYPAIPFVYGAAFEAAVAPVQILLLALLPLSIQRILTMFFVANGYASIFVRVAAVGVGTTVAMDVALIPALGVNGAAIAGLVGAGVEMALAVERFCAITGLRWRDVVAPCADDLAVLLRIVNSVVRRDRLDVRA
jgi:O-antigen/teichoic acid export membrane protein